MLQRHFGLFPGQFDQMLIKYTHTQTHLAHSLRQVLPCHVVVLQQFWVDGCESRSTLSVRTAAAIHLHHPMWVCVCTHMSVWVYVCVCVWVWVCMCMRVHARLCVCVCGFIYPPASCPLSLSLSIPSSISFLPTVTYFSALDFLTPSIALPPLTPFLLSLFLSLSFSLSLVWSGTLPSVDEKLCIVIYWRGRLF